MTATAVDPARLAPLILAGGVAAALHVGKIPAVLSTLQREFAMTLIEASFLVSMMQAAGALLGVVGGVLADRFGHRRLMSAGLFILGVASLAGAFSTSAALLLASRAGESAGFLLTVLPGPALLRRVVGPGNLDRILGWWAAYLPTGMAIGMLATSAMNGSSGWRPAWWLYGAICIGVAVAVRIRIPPDPARGQASMRLGSMVGLTARAPGPWLLAACFGLYAGQFTGIFSFLPTIYEAAGIGAATTGLLTAIGVAINVVGNIGAGRLIHGGMRPGVLLIGAALMMAALAAFAFTTDVAFAIRYAAVLVFSVIAGLIPGALFVISVRLAPDPQTVATTVGMMQQGSALGQVIAPPVIAAVATAAGGWHSTGWTVAAFAIADAIAAAAILRLLRERGPR